AQAELSRWRALSPANADAGATAHRIWNAVDDGALRGQLPMPPSAAQERRARRRTIGLLGVAGLAALAGLFAGGWLTRLTYRLPRQPIAPWQAP
ncbi:hypothetical protein FGX01_05415, partial [Xylella fastidiosa subsp. multiplex]|nr:hypothetical protein [Xylella fastidiosa subsp. multiplex]